MTEKQKVARKPKKVKEVEKTDNVHNIQDSVVHEKAKTKIVAWKVTDAFKNHAMEILIEYPYIKVSTLINKIKALNENPESEINAVLSELGQYPYKDVHTLIEGVQKTCTPIYE